MNTEMVSVDQANSAQFQLAF